MLMVMNKVGIKHVIDEWMDGLMDGWIKYMNERIIVLMHKLLDICRYELYIHYVLP